MDVMGLLNQMEEDGSVAAISRNPVAQFGTRTRRYAGPSILPERPVEDNIFEETNIKYRTVIANAGTRYSPVQIKEGVMVGSFLVKLAESDIGSEFKARDYDALVRHLRTGDDMQAVMQLTRFLTTTVNLPLVEWNERARWQAIVNSQVQLRGNNGYEEDVNYSAPSGHRPTVGGTWSSDAYDPYDDIYAIVQLLADKGFIVTQIWTSRRVAGIMAGNAKVAARANRITVSSTGQIQGINGRITIADINAINAADGLPAIQLYDLSYRTQTGQGRFMPNDVMVFVCESGNDEELDLLNGEIQILPDTLGYVGVGRPAGQSDPGRVILSEFKRRKPPRIENEGWQTSLPVITEPEGLAVLKGIN